MYNFVNVATTVKEVLFTNVESHWTTFFFFFCLSLAYITHNATWQVHKRFQSKPQY